MGFKKEAIMAKVKMGQTTPEAIAKRNKLFVEGITESYESGDNIVFDLIKEKENLDEQINDYDNITEPLSKKRYKHLQTLISLQRFKVMVLKDLLVNHNQVKEHLK